MGVHTEVILSKDTTEEDEGLVPSEASVDWLDQEDFRNVGEAEQKKAIVSVRGQDVNEEDLDKAA